MFINGNELTIKDVVNVARNYERVELSEGSRSAINKSRELIDKIIVGDKSIYGVNTGFGKFATIKIDKENLSRLQINLIRSHSCGVGNPLNKDVVRAAMLLRANMLAKGYSGVRVQLVEKLLELLNKDVIPYIPEKGSLGASGDLAPLAHLALLLIGEGMGYYKDKLYDGKTCLKKAGVEPIQLKEKEGLALINGTPVLTALAVLAIYESEFLLKAAEIAAAFSIEALLATDAFLYDKIHRVRNIDGQIICAENLRNLVKGSPIIASHKDCENVQDAYSLRCSPQVIGMFHEVLKFVTGVVEKEINSACDNPLVFEDRVLSCGNFHGEPIAQAMDFFAISLSEIGNISERRIFRYQDKTLNNGLPACLINDSGLNSGFMITQYVAAALVSENKILCHPASVDSIPTAANQEDHVSMGSIASNKAMKVVQNVKYIIAIELLNACQAIDFRKPLATAISTTRTYEFIRNKLNIPFIEHDSCLSEYIKTMYNNIPALVNYVEEITPLKI